MTIGQLKQYIKNMGFSDDTPIVIHDWQGKSLFMDAESCVNFEHQQENKVCMLRKGLLNEKFSQPK